MRDVKKFNYSNLGTTVNKAFCILTKAGYTTEANALAALTHVIRHRVAPLNLSDTERLNDESDDYISNIQLLNNFLNENEQHNREEQST